MHIRVQFRENQLRVESWNLFIGSVNSKHMPSYFSLNFRYASLTLILLAAGSGRNKRVPILRYNPQTASLTVTIE